MTGLFADWALLPEGWRSHVRVTISQDGFIESVTPNISAHSTDQRLPGKLLVPAPGNLHSHAFQRAMAGHAETRNEGHGSFWTWRETMYGFLAQLDPDDIEAIAAFAYMEMLETGFAAVGEFHYLHHAANGTAYENPAEMAQRIIAASKRTGMGLTLLPVLYERGGTDNRPLNTHQSRFGCDWDRYQTLHHAIKLSRKDQVLGVAAHSLRAVTPDNLARLASTYQDLPLHLHIAEQEAEVRDVIQSHGTSPVAWLLDNIPVGSNWCLVHATHMSHDETTALARSGAIAGLCPVTEGNLGDGIFSASDFITSGGRYGLGSDSNIRISLTEEMRLLEYSQRFKERRRAVMRRDPGSVGHALFQNILGGGAAALQRPSGQIAPGFWADMIALDADTILPFVPSSDQWMDHWIFVSGDTAVQDVWSAGRPMVQQGSHIHRESISAAFRETMARLMETF
jgi:formiminoglutamate deiminase